LLALTLRKNVDLSTQKSSCSLWDVCIFLSHLQEASLEQSKAFRRRNSVAGGREWGGGMGTCVIKVVAREPAWPAHRFASRKIYPKRLIVCTHALLPLHFSQYLEKKELNKITKKIIVSKFYDFFFHFYKIEK